MDKLRCNVEGVRVVWRRHHRVRPPESVVDVCRPPPVVRLRIGGNVAHLLATVVVAVDPMVVAGVYDVRVLSINRDVPVFTTSYRIPVLDRYPTKI